jgi:hypothetical protein
MEGIRVVPDPAPADALQTLLQVNQALRAALVFLDPAHTLCSSVRAQHFHFLLIQILRAGECLRQPRATAESAALTPALREYLEHLHVLRQILPDLHANLLAEKARLEVAQSHITAATAWVRANRATL